MVRQYLLVFPILLFTLVIQTEAQRYRPFEQILHEVDEGNALSSPLVKRPFERKDGSVVVGRMPAFVKNSGVGREIMSDDMEKPSKFARKNCFFSPVQCSFFYKRNFM